MTGPKQVPADLVRAAIEDDPVVKQALGRRLLNVRALAREIQRSSKTEATLESIVSAVHRYPVESSANRVPMGKLIAKLALRDKVTAIGIINSDQAWRAISKLPERVQGVRGDVLRVISGVEATTVILDSKNADVLLSAVPKESIARIYADLAEVLVHLSEDAWETTGVLSTLSTQLTLNGVNIYYHFGYGPPPIIVFEVAEQDAANAYRVLAKLRKKSGK